MSIDNKEKLRADQNLKLEIRAAKNKLQSALDTFNTIKDIDNDDCDLIIKLTDLIRERAVEILVDKDKGTDLTSLINANTQYINLTNRPLIGVRIKNLLCPDGLDSAVSGFQFCAPEIEDIHIERVCEKLKTVILSRTDNIVLVAEDNQLDRFESKFPNYYNFIGYSKVRFTN